MNNDKKRNVKDSSIEEFSKKYGNYVENDLVPQLSKLNALKLGANPIEWNVSSKNKKLDAIVKELLDDALTTVDVNKLLYILEEKLSREGNGVIVFENTPTGEVNAYVPTVAITRVDPSSGDLLYLQIIRYIEGGDLINVVSELHTLTETTFTHHQYPNQESAEHDIKQVKKSNGKQKLKGNKEIKKDETFDRNTEGINFGEPIPNVLGWIKAVYFENMPTIDGRGRPDINPESRYVGLLNETFIRFHWEMKFNKSKLIMDEEMGTNLFSSRYQTEQNQGMVEDNFVVRRNSFMYGMGQASGANQYFETTNQNLVNLITFFNYFLKKLWEQSGQHQSGSDIGKQLSDYQAVQEKSAEHLTYKNKILRRKFIWRKLLWRIILSLDSKHSGGLGKAPKGLNIKNISPIMTYAKIDVEKDIIDNEIKKMQANLTDRQQAMLRIAELAPGTDIEALAENVLSNNNKDINKQMMAMPIQVQTPSISNPQGKDNKQSKAFYNQDKKGDKE